MSMFQPSFIIVLFHIPILLGYEVLVCRNNGTLKIQGREQSCICPDPFTGQYCEDYPCVNGISIGLQYDPESLFINKRCLCDSGWTGLLCSTSLFNRCGENGIEVNGQCQCNKNFVGDRCQYVTRCVNGQLYNGRCACHYGWAGDYCDQIICHQGQADASNKSCICPAKYRGKYCDFCAGPSSSPPPECAVISGRLMIQIEGHNVKIVVTVVVGVILLVLGILFCLLHHNVALSKKLSKKKTMRQTTTDVEMQSTNADSEHCALKCTLAPANSKETTVDSNNCFHSPPPPYHYALASAQKEPTVPRKGESKAKAENTSNLSEVSFFLGDGNSANEKTEQEKLKPMNQPNAVEKQQKAKVNFSDDTMENVGSVEHMSNI